MEAREPTAHAAGPREVASTAAPVRTADPGAWTRESRPRLARKVRLQWNAPREQALLLYPEGALALNPTARAVLELCDGRRTLGEIVGELAATFDGSAVQHASGEGVALSTDPGTGDVSDSAPQPAAGGAGVTSSEGGVAGGLPTASSDERRGEVVERDVKGFLDQLARRGWLIDEGRGEAGP